MLAEIVRRLAEAYRPERIYLFGSTARGDAGPNSDYDLMIIVSEDAPAQLRSEDLAYRALRGTGTAADALVWTRNSFDKQLHLKLLCLRRSSARDDYSMEQVDPILLFNTKEWLLRAKGKRGEWPRMNTDEHG